MVRTAKLTHGQIHLLHEVEAEMLRQIDDLKYPKVGDWVCETYTRGKIHSTTRSAERIVALSRRQSKSDRAHFKRHRFSAFHAAGEEKRLSDSGPDPDEKASVK